MIKHASIIVLFLFLCAFDSWAECGSRPSNGICSASQYCNYSRNVRSQSECDTWCKDQFANRLAGCYYGYSSFWKDNTCVAIACDTQAEADSLKCALNPSAPGCAPQIDSTACNSYRSTCENQGGKFTGDLTAEGCRGYCNLCQSAYYNRQRNKFVNACCGAGYAPPDDLDTAQCSGQASTGVGMSYSDPLTCGGGYACECNDPEEQPGLFADFCVGGERYDENPEEGGEGAPADSSGGAPGDTLPEGEGDWEYDYYPILDTIRDTLNKKIAPDIRSIADCLTSGSCVGGGDTVIVNDNDTTIVNIPSDSILLKAIADSISNQDYIDYTIRDSLSKVMERLKLINDNTTQYLHSLDSFNRAGFDSLLSGNFVPGDTSTDRGGFGSADSLGQGWADSLASAIGWAGGMDSVDIDSLYSGVSVDSFDVSGVDSVNNAQLASFADSLGGVLRDSIAADKNNLPDTLDKYADSLIAVAPFSMFDSLVYGTLGSRIPNTNECPDGCFSWSLSLPRFGLVNYTVDYGVCLGRSALGGLNALSFIRLLVRLFVVVACIWFVIWNFSKRK